MSLKFFHIFFIIVSILLSCGFAAWMFQSYMHDNNLLTLLGGVASILVGIALAMYGVRFLRKLKHVSYL